MSILIAPSILAADHARLAEEIHAVEQAGADLLHIDVMDGRFVPNLTLGPPIIRSMRRVSKLPFDVHLMIEAPENSCADYVAAGANTLTIHAEACVHLYRTLTHIRSLGCRVGVSLNPATPLQMLTHVLPLVDVVLVMTVNPGFGGQTMITSMLGKIADLAEMKRRFGYAFQIEVDGGINAENIASVQQAGAQVVVVGSALFSSGDYVKTFQLLRQAAQKTAEMG